MVVCGLYILWVFWTTMCQRKSDSNEVRMIARQGPSLGGPLCQAEKNLRLGGKDEARKSMGTLAKDEGLRDTGQRKL